LATAFGETLALFRRRAGTKQSDLARAVGWANASTVSRVEAGQIAIDAGTADRLCAALGLAPEERTALLNAS